MSRLDGVQKRTRGVDEVKEWVYCSVRVMGGCGWEGTLSGGFQSWSNNYWT